jgi:hypothetical protein
MGSGLTMLFTIEFANQIAIGKSGLYRYAKACIQTSNI